MPEKTPKNDLQQKRLHFDFGHHLLKISVHEAFILPKFPQMLPGF